MPTRNQAVGAGGVTGSGGGGLTTASRRPGRQITADDQIGRGAAHKATETIEERRKEQEREAKEIQAEIDRALGIQREAQTTDSNNP
jgi:hypothetical protein